MTTLVHKQPVQTMTVIEGVASVSLTHADFTTAGVAQVITWATLRAKSAQASDVPANAEIMGAYLVRVTDFSGGSTTAITVDVGDAGNDDELLAAVDVFTGAKATATFTVTNQEPQRLEITKYVAIVTLGSVTDDLDQVDAGACELRIRWRAHDLATQT